MGEIIKIRNGTEFSLYLQVNFASELENNGIFYSDIYSFENIIKLLS